MKIEHCVCIDDYISGSLLGVGSSEKGKSEKMDRKLLKYLLPFFSFDTLLQKASYASVLTGKVLHVCIATSVRTHPRRLPRLYSHGK